MNLRLATPILLGAFAFTALAQEKWTPPTAPDGWKYVASRDGACQVLFPNESTGSGSRERTITRNGSKFKAMSEYCKLKDGVTLELLTVNMSGPGVRNMKPGEIYDVMIGIDQELGFQTSEPKDAAFGKSKGREYRLTSDKSFGRVAMLANKNQVYSLRAQADEEKKLDDERVTQFLKSLVVVPADVVEAKAKQQSESAAAANKEKSQERERLAQEAMKKHGIKWSMKLDDMTPPDAEAVGVVLGREFKPDAVSLSPLGRLTFKQGKDIPPDCELTVTLGLKPRESIENRTFEFGPAGKERRVHLTMSAKIPGEVTPKYSTHLDNFALKVIFGAKGADGTVSGTIYVCAPDDSHSFFAGKFSVKVK